MSQTAFITKHAPSYSDGSWNSFALYSMAGAPCTASFSGGRTEKSRKEQDLGNGYFSPAQGKLDDLGDDHPDLRYTIQLALEVCRHPGLDISAQRRWCTHVEKDWLARIIVEHHLT